MAVCQCKSLHADCAVFLRPLSPWQPQGIVRSLSKVSKLLSGVCTLVGVHLGGAMALTHHNPHVISYPVPSTNQTLSLLILLCPELYVCSAVVM